METEVGVMWLQVKKWLELPDDEIGKERILSKIPRREHEPTRFQISILQNCQRIHICCFKPSSLQSFVKQPQEIQIWY